MGVVYKARDPFIGRLVALKTINSNLVDRPDLLERFYQEAQSAGKLQHPNIVTVFELGQEKDTPFIAMEYLDGDSLEKTIVRQSELPLALKVGYVVRICQALEYAHKNRVVHRDIKPGNIMVNSEGVVKVVDFGIARLVDFSRTHTNMMIGTPAYMAPELFRKKKADERTDIWAVGVTFYELLCYQRPFTGDGYDIIRTIMEDEFPPLASIVPECAAEIEPIIQRMLRKQAGERYQGMEDVLLDLEPVWNRLRMSAAVTLAERARELYELGDLPTAYDTLRRARQIDNSNAQAKSLLEKITSEIRRSEIQPKVQEHLSRGRNFLQAGQFREAQAEAEAALGLDSRHEPAQKLFSEVEAAAARAQQLEQKLRLTKQRLAEGALIEAETALRQAFELDSSHPQAQELKRQIEEEQARRERRKQLNELLHRARTLWTDLKYDECLALTSEALKNFPNDPELRNLHETAKADQAEQKKQVHISEIRRLLGQRKLAEARKGLEVLAKEQPQDTMVRNLQTLLTQEEQEEKRKKRLEDELTSLRSLVSTGNFREAAAKGEGLLKEFPEEYEVNDLVSYAKSEVAQQELKKNAEEREKQVRGLLETQRFREAAELARRTLQEFPRQELFRSLASEAEEKWKEQQEKEKVQREVQQRVQEIRSKIKRQELTDAIDMARQTLAAFGPDTDVTQLLHAAEVEANQRDRKRDERSQKLKDARTLVEKQDYAGATQLLQNAIANRVLEPADAQTKMMFAEISEREEVFRKEQQKRKREEEKKREEKNREEEKRRKEAQKQGKPESKSARPSADEAKPSSGSGSRGPAQPMPPPNVPPAVAPTMHESATSIAASGTRPKPSVPVMTPLPAVQPGRVIQTSVRVEERIPDTSTTPAAREFLRKPAVLAVLGLALAGGIYAAIHFWPKGPEPVPPGDVSLEAEAKQLWANRKFDEALADWTKLADHPGPLHQEAVKQMADISQKHVAVEQLYTQGMRLLYEERKYPEAAEKFNEVVQMNLWKTDEARRAYDIASKGPGEAPIKPLWHALFEDGKQAFDKKDYGTAAQDLQQAVHTSGVSKDISSQSQRLLSVIRDREEQKRMLDQAVQLERSGSKQQAKDMFGRVMKAPNGDPELSASAKQQIDQIGVIAPPPNPNPIPPPPKPAPDYGPVLGEVRSLIGQGKWDDAEGKLNGVPAGQGDSNDLRRQIESGRQEDQEFNARKGAASRAVVDKNEAVLKESSKYFAPIASQGGRHASEASDITVRIDRTLKELESSKTTNSGPTGNGGTTPVTNDVAAINAVIQRFAKAYDEGNLGALRAVREYDPKDEKRLPDILNSVKGKGYSLRNCTVPQISGDTGSVTCDAILTKMKDAKPFRTNIQLKNFDGQWIIVSSN